MKIINYKEIDSINNPHGVQAKKLHENDNVQVMHILLKAKESLNKHTTPVDVFFYVLEGEGIIEIGDEKMKVGKDMLIDSPKDIPHCLYNEGENDFRVLVVKTPMPNQNKIKQSIKEIVKG